MGFIIELVVWLIIEVVFWGIMCWTGYFLTQVFTIGRLKYAPVGSGKTERSEKKFILTALIGAFFWIGAGIAIALAW